VDTKSNEHIKLLVQRSRSIGNVLTSAPVPARVRIMAATDAGKTLLLMSDNIDALLKLQDAY